MREAHRALDAARGCHYEDHQAALDEAVRAHEIADTLDDGPLRCRALVLQAAVMLQRGDLHGAVTLTTEATPFAEGDAVRAELAAVKSQLNFFAGSYPESPRPQRHRARRPHRRPRAPRLRPPLRLRGLRQPRRRGLTAAARRRPRPGDRGRRRSMILSTVAEALHEAGRAAEAYRVLSRSVEIERRAFQKLTRLQRGLERATAETRAARDQRDTLAAENRELEAVVRQVDEARPCCASSPTATT